MTYATAIPRDAHTIDHREMVIHIDADYGHFRIEGSRNQLEAEGIIPAGHAWPDRNHVAEWCIGDQRFRLGRTKPPGYRGPMSGWIAGDWWAVHVIDTAFTLAQRRVMRLRLAMFDAIHEETPLGQQQRSQFFHRLVAARYDNAFRRFCDGIPGLNKPRRGRKGV